MWLLISGESRKSGYEEICDEVNRIHQEWGRVRKRLDDTTDPDLVDSVIYELKSLEKRYGFLIKKLKEYKRSVI
ncbi:Protein of unknown function [Melghirimyces algeriensis]|uniref:Uncharacterized protein n=1 Tax=Melghirimyces algeriensis TaxID=910412 RepID=A0A521CJ77_9BACL|nr:Protein of unknown function [Melghirimyces algeriensis]